MYVSSRVACMHCCTANSIKYVCGSRSSLSTFYIYNNKQRVVFRDRNTSIKTKLATLSVLFGKTKRLSHEYSQLLLTRDKSCDQMALVAAMLGAMAVLLHLFTYRLAVQATPEQSCCSSCSNIQV